MVALTRPDVYVEESLLTTTAPVNSTVAVAAFAAPAPRGPITPVKLQSWSDVTKKFGQLTGIAAQDVLVQALLDTLNNGTRTCWAVRAVGAGALPGFLAFSVSNGVAVVAATGVEISAINPGVWGNQIYVEVVDSPIAATRKTVYVRLVPTGAAITTQQIVETWNDVSLDPTDGRYFLALVNSAIGGSNYISVALRTTASAYTYTAGDKLTNTAAGGAKLAGGADGAAVTPAVIRDAVYTLDVVTEPFVLNLPGWTDATTITYLADYADPARTRTDGDPGRGDVFVVVDPDPGVTEAACATKFGTYPKSDVLAGYYPCLVVNDSSNLTLGSTKLVPPGPSVIGRYMATDATRGVFKSPAGIADGRLNGVIALDPAAKLRNADLNTLHAANVNAIKTVPGNGPATIFGMRTLKIDYVTRYIAARRTLIQVRADLELAALFAIAENNDSFLWASLYDRADKICRELHAARGLKGATAAQAYFIKCDADNNTQTDIENGRVNLQVGLALQRPAEFVVLNISQFAGGGADVTELLTAA